MQTKIDIAHLGHSIMVLNKWNEVQLVIDGEVRDTYKAVIAFPFTLRGTIESEGRQIEIVLQMKLRILGGTLTLSADGQELAKTWML